MEKVAILFFINKWFQCIRVLFSRYIFILISLFDFILFPLFRDFGLNINKQIRINIKKCSNPIPTSCVAETNRRLHGLKKYIYKKGNII